MHEYKIWNVIPKENKVEIHNLCGMSFGLALLTFFPQMEEIMAAEHHVYLAVVEKKFRSCTIAGREEEMRRNEKSGLQRWKKRRAAKSKIISGDSLIIQTKVIIA